MASRGHRSFAATFKLKVIQLAEEKGKHHASQVFKMDRCKISSLRKCLCLKFEFGFMVLG